MFHNVLMTSLTPLSNTNEIHCWDNRPFTTVWPEVKQEKIKDTSVKKTIKKRNKRNRTMFTTEQVRILEKIFSQTKYIDVDRRIKIAECLQIEQKCVKIWFQNRRMKEKKELLESSESASEGVAESVSPTLGNSRPSNNVVLDNSYLQPYIQSQTVRPPQYYYAPNNYLSSVASQNKLNSYDISTNCATPRYVNYNDYFSPDANILRSNTEYSAQYNLPQAEFKYYCDAGDIKNQCVNSNTNIQDWPINIFDTSYL